MEHFEIAVYDNLTKACETIGGNSKKPDSIY